MANCTRTADTPADPAAPQGAAAVDGPPGCRPEGQPDAASIDSAALLRGGKSVLIKHNGEFYRLQSTRQGKLILTK